MGQDYELEPLRPIQEVKGWDVFLDPPTIAEEGSVADRKWFDNMEKATKIFIYILTFILVLGCAVISKGTLLFMTSQISLDDTKEYCNQELGEDKTFKVTLPPVERALWIWILMFAYFIPQLGTFLRSLRILCFKRWEMPSISDATLITITESMSTIGYALLIYCILPELDVVKGAMLTNAVCVVPALLGMLSRKAGCNVSSLQAILDCLSLVGQLTAFVMWPRLGTLRIIWLIPVSLVLISCGWWENYISDDSRIPFIRNLSRKNKSFQNDRYFIYVFVSLWKCTLFFVSVIVIFWLREDNVKFLFDNFTLAFQEHQINIVEILPLISTGPNAPDFDSAIQSGPGTEITTSSLTPLILLLINSVSTYLCYACAKFTCKIIIQSFSFALPINLAVPVTLSALVAMCGRYSHDVCTYQSTIPSYLFFDSPPLYQLSDFIVHEQSWVWLVWLLSQAWCTVHVWQATFEKLARTETLFVRPMFEAFLIDQDVALNRRRDVSGVVGVRKRREDEEDDDDVSVLGEDTQNEDNTTLIYACGTMWHETKEEMMAFLKSIFRLDEEQCARKNSRTAFENYKTSDYFDLETHIFFDDAFIRRNEHDNDPQLNIYVRTLLEAVDESATAVHGTEVRLNAPKIYLSPYGGRLEWTLPGDTKMYAHLKDKAKIRPKKRWSQVMYMYYLLGHRLTDNNFMSAESKQTKAENTYILALDGDIDFQPKAVDLLVDLMRKNKSLGAACGRIHPMGSGPMVWYQMFEYAIGHWLQKATEHMIGCVLCSPGCFSLFRGSALMDDSVMRKYTTQSSEAIHYVQYDQGEDRWLCTLLLQRGYKVEYSAASDAFTHCPEGFYEFYNQRRRWMPSTTANIMDLLGDYKRTIAANENISRLYILYQVVLMVGTILGPGTIFLMLVGAFVAAFQMEQWTSFLWNAVPIIVYMAICFLFNEKVQLFVAGFISAVYGLVMMAVLVGIMLQIQNDGLMAPSSLFFFCVAGEMIITALFHPKEIECLPYGIVYYITVPSMYMLLVIYSVFNMNNVSWGTREVTIVPEEKDDDIEAGAKPIIPEKPSGVKHKILNFFGNVNSDTSGSFELSFAGLFKCLLCTHSTTSEEQLQLQRLNINIDAITRKLESLQLQLLTGVVTSNSEEDAVDSQPRRRTTKHISGLKGDSIIDDNASDAGSTSKESNFSSVCENSWLFDKGLGPTSYLKSHETEFWKDVIDKYLKPIDDSKTKATIAKNLKDLRDKSVFAFFMLNSVFVLVVFLLTLKKDDIHIKWPLGVKANFTYQDDTGDIVLMKEHLQLEPIGFVFLIFFAVLLVVQFIAMLLHRFGTLSQILANTVVNFTLLKKKKTNEEEIKSGNVVNIVKKIQRIRDDDNDTSRIQSIHRRRTVQKIIQQRPESSTFNLTEKFNERMNQYKNDENYKGPVHRNTIARLTRGNLGNLGNRNSDSDVILRHRNSTRRPGTSSGVTFSGINNEAFIIDDSGA